MTQICCCGGDVSKGSTPSLSFNINTPLTNINAMYLTFYQREMLILEKNKDEIIIVDEDTIKIKLTQEETLLFSAKYPVQVQIRIKYDTANGGSAAVTSGITEFHFNEVLKHEVI